MQASDSKVNDHPGHLVGLARASAYANVNNPSPHLSQAVCRNAPATAACPAWRPASGQPAHPAVSYSSQPSALDGKGPHQLLLATPAHDPTAAVPPPAPQGHATHHSAAPSTTCSPQASANAPSTAAAPTAAPAAPAPHSGSTVTIAFRRPPLATAASASALLSRTPGGKSAFQPFNSSSSIILSQQARYNPQPPPPLPNIAPPPQHPAPQPPFHHTPPSSFQPSQHTSRCTQALHDHHFYPQHPHPPPQQATPATMSAAPPAGPHRTMPPPAGQPPSAPRSPSRPATSSRAQEQPLAAVATGAATPKPPSPHPARPQQLSSTSLASPEADPPTPMPPTRHPSPSGHPRTSPTPASSPPRRPTSAPSPAAALNAPSRTDTVTDASLQPPSSSKPLPSSHPVLAPTLVPVASLLVPSLVIHPHMARMPVPPPAAPQALRAQGCPSQVTTLPSTETLTPSSASHLTRIPSTLIPSLAASWPAGPPPSWLLHLSSSSGSHAGLPPTGPPGPPPPRPPTSAPAKRPAKSPFLCGPSTSTGSSPRAPSASAATTATHSAPYPSSGTPPYGTIPAIRSLPSVGPPEAPPLSAPAYANPPYGAIPAMRSLPSVGPPEAPPLSAPPNANPPYANPPYGTIPAIRSLPSVPPPSHPAAAHPHRPIPQYPPYAAAAAAAAWQPPHHAPLIPVLNSHPPMPTRASTHHTLAILASTHLSPYPIPALHSCQSESGTRPSFPDAAPLLPRSISAAPIPSWPIREVTVGPDGRPEPAEQLLAPFTVVGPLHYLAIVTAVEADRATVRRVKRMKREHQRMDQLQRQGQAAYAAAAMQSASARTPPTAAAATAAAAAAAGIPQQGSSNLPALPSSAGAHPAPHAAVLHAPPAADAPPFWSMADAARSAAPAHGQQVADPPGSVGAPGPAAAAALGAATVAGGVEVQLRRVPVQRRSVSRERRGAGSEATRSASLTLSGGSGGGGVLAGGLTALPSVGSREVVLVRDAAAPPVITTGAALHARSRPPPAPTAPSARTPPPRRPPHPAPAASLLPPAPPFLDTHPSLGHWHTASQEASAPWVPATAAPAFAATTAAPMPTAGPPHRSRVPPLDLSNATWTSTHPPLSLSPQPPQETDPSLHHTPFDGVPAPAAHAAHGTAAARSTAAVHVGGTAPGARPPPSPGQKRYREAAEAAASQGAGGERAPAAYPRAGAKRARAGSDAAPAPHPGHGAMGADAGVLQGHQHHHQGHHQQPPPAQQLERAVLPLELRHPGSSGLAAGWPWQQDPGASPLLAAARLWPQHPTSAANAGRLQQQQQQPPHHHDLHHQLNGDPASQAGARHLRHDAMTHPHPPNTYAHGHHHPQPHNPGSPPPYSHQAIAYLHPPAPLHLPHLQPPPYRTLPAPTQPPTTPGPSSPSSPPAGPSPTSTAAAPPHAPPAGITPSLLPHLVDSENIKDIANGVMAVLNALSAPRAARKDIMHKLRAMPSSERVITYVELRDAVARGDEADARDILAELSEGQAAL